MTAPQPPTPSGHATDAGNAAPPVEVGAMFDRISGVYDVMNAIISGFQEPRWRRRAVAMAGVGVGAAGGAIGDMANANTSLATALHRAGVCIFVAAYIFIAGLHIAAWTYRWHLRSYRRSVSTPLQCTGVHHANFTALPAINWYQLCLSVSRGTSGLCRACSLVSFGSSWTPPLFKCHHRKIQPCDRELDPILGAGSCDGMGGSRALPVRQHGACTEKTSLVTNRHLALRKYRYI